MSFLNFRQHFAYFYDSNNDFVGKKLIESSFRSTLGISKKVIFFKEGAYNIKPRLASRIDVNTFFVNKYIYVYYLGNPDPLDFSNAGRPIMEPEDYKIRLKSKLVEDLNKAAEGDFKIPWKWVLIIVLGLVLAYYVFSGHGLSSLWSSHTAVNSSLQNLTNSSSSSSNSSITIIRGSYNAV
jgi:hypothetical protein